MTAPEFENDDDPLLAMISQSFGEDPPPSPPPDLPHNQSVPLTVIGTVILLGSRYETGSRQSHMCVARQLCSVLAGCDSDISVAAPAGVGGSRQIEPGPGRKFPETYYTSRYSLTTVESRQPTGAGRAPCLMSRLCICSTWGSPAMLYST